MGTFYSTEKQTRQPSLQALTKVVRGINELNSA